MESRVKNLYLLRHAKSSWDDPSLSDGERPLNGRGRRDAPRMGEALGARLVPMTFYVSPAERAQQTFSALARYRNYPLNVNNDVFIEAQTAFKRLHFQLDDLVQRMSS